MRSSHSQVCAQTSSGISLLPTSIPLANKEPAQRTLCLWDGLCVKGGFYQGHFPHCCPRSKSLLAGLLEPEVLIGAAFREKEKNCS